MKVSGTFYAVIWRNKPSYKGMDAYFTIREPFSIWSLNLAHLLTTRECAEQVVLYRNILDEAHEPAEIITVQVAVIETRTIIG